MKIKNEQRTSNLLFVIIFTQELFPGSKYKMTNEQDSYRLTIMNPKVEDTGKITIEIGGITSTAFLQVEEPDPTYNFTKHLKKTLTGYTKHEVVLECAVSNSLAIVSWWKGETKLEDGEEFQISKDLSGVCRLIIKKAKFEDAGKYSCKIEKQTDKTNCELKIIGQYTNVEKKLVCFLYVIFDIVYFYLQITRINSPRYLSRNKQLKRTPLPYSASLMMLQAT